MSGTPMDHGPGYVVRLRCGGGGLSYSSHRMTKQAVETAAQDAEWKLDHLDDGDYFHFESEHGLVRIRCERITAIETIRCLLPGPSNGRKPTMKQEVETR